MNIILIKSKIANMPGFHLLNGRWHRLSPELHGAGAQHAGKHLSDDEWNQLYLPEDNANARTHNPALKKLRAMSEAGDINGILSQGVGTNTYGKRYSKIANHLLERHGVAHRVTPGQKAGEHPQVKSKPLVVVQKELFDNVSNKINNEPVVTKQPEAKVDVTELSSSKISIAYSRLFSGKMSIGDFKKQVRAGEMNDHGGAIMQALADQEAEEKAAKSAKNQAWKDKHLPKLVAAKKAAEEKKVEEIKQKINAQGDPNGKRTYLNVPFADKEYAKKNGARWDADKKKWYHTHSETPAALKSYEIKTSPSIAPVAQSKPVTPSSEPKKFSLPSYGRVSEDDPSIYGSWLLGHEGELWSSVRHLAPKK